MSAFIIDKDTMDRVVSAIIQADADGLPRDLNFTHLATGRGNGYTELGRTLFDMNLDAVTQRYPQDTKETAPGPCDISTIHEGYRFRRTHPTRIEGHKAIRCLLYQCSEGDVPETNPFFEKLGRVCDHIANEIVRELPAYEKAAWG